MDILRVFGIVLGINAVVWLFIIMGFKRTQRRLTESINRMCITTGECAVIAPQVAHRTQMKGWVSSKTFGVMALTDRRLIFRGPFGMTADIDLDQIEDMSQNLWFHGNYRNAKEFMILKLKDGAEVAFQTKNEERWMDEIRSRISA